MEQSYCIINAHDLEMIDEMLVRAINICGSPQSQVNNVVADKSPTSLNLTKLLKNPWIYVGVFSILFLSILWVWSPGLLQNEEHKTKWW